jgi:hypothetical protein
MLHIPYAAFHLCSELNAAVAQEDYATAQQLKAKADVSDMCYMIMRLLFEK